MFFERLYETRLAQASYIIGCQKTGDALIVDPNRDIAQYIAAATAQRMRITHVTETHIHADFVSGARELAERTGAQLLISGEGGTDWSYGFAGAPNVRVIRNGDAFPVGNLRLDVIHTPGHTPEHLAFILTDVPASPHAVMVLSGDFVFVGDVGRPDLLERAANQADTMDSSARALWKSLQQFRALPDHLQLQPGHGAGSACGKALGAVPSSTVGYEKLVNWAFAAATEDQFVAAVLDGQAEPPAYFARMKRVNKEGPAFVGEIAAPKVLDAAAVGDLHRAGATLLDIRAAKDFAKDHLRGAINVPLTRSFTTYCGSVVSVGPIVLITADGATAQAHDAARELILIGFDEIAGTISVSALASGVHAEMNRVAAKDAIAQHASGVRILDVRSTPEWLTGHVAGSQFIPFAQLVSRLGEIAREGPLLVMCESGARSAIATSILQREGYAATDAGGIVQWERAGGAIEYASIR